MIWLVIGLILMGLAIVVLTTIFTIVAIFNVDFDGLGEDSYDLDE